MTLNVNHKLIPFLTKPQPIKIVIGGRSSGKSLGIGDMLTFKMSTEKADIYCLREYLGTISDSVHKVFKGSIEKRLNLKGWDIQENKIIAPNGARTTYTGANRNPDAMQGAQDYKYSWFEEAHRASQISLDKLLPTIIRNPGAQCWFSANPQSAEDPFSKRFINPYLDKLKADGVYEDELHYIVFMNWRDNPWRNKEQDTLREWDYKNLSRAKYRWIWEGDFNDDVESSIIKAEWFDAAIDAHKKLGITPTGATIFSHDPADIGKDSKAYAIRKGIHYYDIGEIQAENGNIACRAACDIAINNNADLFVWDGDGMGALLREQIAQSFNGIKCELRMYKGSEKPDDADVGNTDIFGFASKSNKNTFANMRALRYIQLAKRFYNTYLWVEKGEYQNPDSVISIDSGLKCINKLRSEVCRVPLTPNGSGKIQLMSKQMMKKKHQIDSPGMADCLAMCEELPASINDFQPINFDSEF